MFNKIILTLVLTLSFGISHASSTVPIPKPKPLVFHDTCKYIISWPGGIISEEVKCNKSKIENE